MAPRMRLRGRLLLSHLVVVVVGAVTIFATVGLVAPGAFDAAMGPSMAGMGTMMSDLVRTAFQNALQSALVVAVIAAAAAAVVISIALSTRLSGPISRLAAASRRIADGHYAERVSVASSDEIGELAESFNRMAASLESTERRRLQLVGDVAHELRTPLTTLDGYLEGLEDGVIAPADPTWKLLRRETARLSHLVNDLQELWRAEARQLPLSLAWLTSRSSSRRSVSGFPRRPWSMRSSCGLRSMRGRRRSEPIEDGWPRSSTTSSATRSGTRRRAGS